MCCSGCVSRLCVTAVGCSCEVRVIYLEVLIDFEFRGVKMDWFVIICKLKMAQLFIAKKLFEKPQLLFLIFEISSKTSVTFFNYVSS